MIALVRLAIAFAFLASAAPATHAQTTGSRCLAIAQSLPKAVPVAYVKVQEGLEPPAAEEVTIRFVGHATFLITTPAGVTIATDYAGYAGPGVIPRVVTMNHAHPSHYTDNPDPRIEYVLRGWNPAGGKVAYHLTVDDVLSATSPPTSAASARSSRTATRSSSSRWLICASVTSGISTRF